MATVANAGRYRCRKPRTTEPDVSDIDVAVLIDTNLTSSQNVTTQAAEGDVIAFNCELRFAAPDSIKPLASKADGNGKLQLKEPTNDSDQVANTAVKRFKTSVVITAETATIVPITCVAFNAEINVCCNETAA